MTASVVCSVCGKSHPIGDTELVFRLPEEIFLLNEEDRAARCKITPDISTLDDRLFLRSLLPLPVEGQVKAYCIGVWVELSPQGLRTVMELWDDPQQSVAPPIEGRLASKIPTQGPTSLGLFGSLKMIGPSSRPEFHIAQTDHPLFAQQQGGITAHVALTYSHFPDARSAV